MSGSEKAHAKYSASSSHRWLTCPGSISLSEWAPPEKERASAVEGTDAHTCLELFMKNGQEKILSTGAFLRKKYPHEMVIHAEDAAKQIWKLTPKGADLYSETKVSLAHIHHDMFGTTDGVIVDHFATIHVIDFKYGKLPVDADENSQMMFYALGEAHKHHYNFDRVETTIIQPRAEHKSGKTTRTFATTLDRLKEWNRIFKEGVKATQAKKPKFVSGEHCFFCPAKTICDTYDPDIAKAIRSKFIKPLSSEEKRSNLKEAFGDLVEWND